MIEHLTEGQWPGGVKQAVFNHASRAQTRSCRSIWISDLHLGTRRCKARELLEFLEQYEAENLFLVGRNGMHKYNNQDHSMLTAMTAVDGIVAGHVDKAALWEINTEQEYHEEKK